jgi:hypothetical protein
MIQIKAPDGAIVQFPDGTPDSVIQGAMGRHYGMPDPQMQRATSDANRRAANTPGVVRAINNGFAFNAMGPLDAASAALETGAHNAFSHLTGQPDSGYGMSDAYSAVKRAEATKSAAFAQNHPVLNTAASLTGAIANPINRAGGRFVAGAGTLPAAMARSAFVGAPVGALYGLNGAPDGQKGQGAVEGGAVGAATGFLAPPMIAAARPLLRAASGVAGDFASGIKNTIRPPDPTGAPSPGDVALAAQKVRQMMLASGVSPSDLAAHPAVIAGKPITTAEAIGRTGINNLGALARRGGATGDALGPMLVDRNSQMPSRIMTDFASAAGIHPEAAAGDIQGLTDKLRKQAGPLYDAALGNSSPVWNTDLAQLAQRPVIKKAIASVGQDFLNAGQDPMAAGLQLDPDTGLHVLNPNLSAANEAQPTAATWDAVKKAIGRQVERNPITGRALPDSQSQGNGGVMTASRDLTTALAGDPANNVPGAIPGYRSALDKAGDYLSLEDAFNKGGALFTNPNVNESAFGSVYKGLDDASQQAFKGGFANKLFDMAQNGQLKPGKFATPRIQQKLATVLGDDPVINPDGTRSPGPASQFLNNVQLEGQMQANGNRMIPGVNSPTFEFGNAAQEQDGGFNPIQALMHGHLNPIKLVGGMVDAGRAVATGPQVRGEMGRLLMQNPATSIGDLSLVPAPAPPTGLFGSQYYPALAAYAAQQSSN